MTAQLSGLDGGNTYDLTDLISGRLRRSRTFAGTRIEALPTDRHSRDKRHAARELAPHPTENIDWQDNAACIDVDVEVMFPHRGDPLMPAKAICAGCAVKSECLEYALRHNEKYGIWGGMSERQRRDERARRRGGVQRVTLGSIKGHALKLKGQIADDGTFGCECGEHPELWYGVLSTRIWHRDHKQQIKGQNR